MSQLKVLDCRNCGRRLAPPAYACSACGSTDLVAVEVSGRGSLYSSTTIYIPPSGFEKLAPYTVAVVQVEGGLLLPGRLELRGDTTPPVGAAIDLVEAGEGFYVFAPAA